jgi:hypothetical protein
VYGIRDARKYLRIIGYVFGALMAAGGLVLTVFGLKA